MRIGRHHAAMIACAMICGGCSPPLPLPPAPEATNPVCAQVILAMPETVMGLRQRTVGAQAATAWGSDPSIVAWCGVVPPGPTTDPCLEVDTPAGASVDWLQQEVSTNPPAAVADLVPPNARGWVFTSYGRTPAVAVWIPADLGIDQPTAILSDLASALTFTETVGHCY